ncbi:MAG: HEAT repeat domain-containing protein, partial [Candidatus Omnitrophica bacterium]|nr:HEAT repeat domain-containing protein [Candidatus Omnitrophota bacterium]
GHNARKASPVLLKALQESDEDVREEAAISLIKVEGAGAFKYVLTNDNLLRMWDTGRIADTIIKYVGGDEAIQAFLKLIKENQYIRDKELFMRKILQVGGPGAIRALQTLFDDGIMPIYCAEEVIEAVGKIGGKEAVKYLGSMLRSDRLLIIEEKRIVEIIISLDKNEALEALLPILYSDSLTKCALAMGGIGKIGGGKALDVLVGLLKGERFYWEKPRVVQIISSMADKDASLEALVSLLNDKDPLVRKYAFEGVGRIGGEKAYGILLAIFNNPVSDKRAEAAASIGATGLPEALNVLTAPGTGIHDKDAFVRENSMIGLARIFAHNPELLTKDYAKLLVRETRVDSITDDLKQVFLKKPYVFFSIANEALEKADTNGGFSDAEEFNFLMFIISMKEFPIERRSECIYLVYRHISAGKDDLKRKIYTFCLCNVFKRFGEKEKTYLNDRFDGLVDKVETLPAMIKPDYDNIFDPKRNPGKEFNVAMYAPLLPEISIAAFIKDGFTVKSTGAVTVYSKCINGKTVNIYLDHSGDPESYKGEVFAHMASPEIHMIVYSGHRGMGASLAFALNKAPRLDLLQCGQKIIAIFACNSAQYYQGQIFTRYPYSQFVGCSTFSYSDHSVEALIAMLEGITAEKNWADIRALIDKAETKSEEMDKSRDPSASRNVKYVYPDQESKYRYFDRDGDGRPDDLRFLPVEGLIRLADNDSFEGAAGRIDLARVISDKPVEVVETVAYFFKWNSFLEDLYYRISERGFKISYSDRNDVCFVTEESGENGKTVYKIAINAQYANSSVHAITMMALYELNLHFSKLKKGRIDIYDKMRGLQMAADFAVRYHKEHLFAAFLKKYGFSNLSIREVIETIEGHDNAMRAKSLDRVLRKIEKDNSPVDVDETKLKSEGLLSLIENVGDEPLRAAGADASGLAAALAGLALSGGNKNKRQEGSEKAGASRLLDIKAKIKKIFAWIVSFGGVERFIQGIVYEFVSEITKDAEMEISIAKQKAAMAEIEEIKQRLLPGDGPRGDTTHSGMTVEPQKIEASRSSLVVSRSSDEKPQTSIKPED